MIIDDVLKDFGSTSAFHHQRVNINQLHAFKKAWQTPDSSYNSCHGSWTYFGMLPLYVEETQVTIVVKNKERPEPADGIRFLLGGTSPTTRYFVSKPKAVVFVIGVEHRPRAGHSTATLK